ncbi:MBL fold metallo-hydrolase [Clostridium botulinum C]|uniref:MBL fold metallo-hydrolase n=5 Tax=Clostridium TaxID=1485 RepID=A0A9Q4TMN6_CLOBO|nr:MULTISPECIES: MBL fold metallo-hydrolase [Clostridium]AYF55069.1 MBL fold metallo-hydrolase [Clostridium novyi]EES91617.1 metallo-beta-lactamase family protein [Clostridium botulinum D str. 1873]KEI10714.1 beta-lactamase [Clostridium sp. K25]KEI13044.1 beta-lactamase [Clostridium novyi B str. NCTC 9691]KEI15845.1 beta-lactamase [Clostridium novyi B str. ATCC 27606]
MKIKRIPAGMYGANCYILIDEETMVGCIIDPGGDADRLANIIDELNIEIKFILLTHGHMDHVGGVEVLREKYNVPVYINGKDKELMEKGTQVFGRIWGKTPEDKELKDEEIIKLGSLDIRCIETPGHTPGGMSFLVNNVVFTGDTLFHGSVGRCDLPGGNQSQLIESIKNKLMVLDDEIVVLPGHEGESNIKFERQYNPFL